MVTLLQKISDLCDQNSLQTQTEYRVVYFNSFPNEQYNNKIHRVEFKVLLIFYTCMPFNSIL